MAVDLTSWKVEGAKAVNLDYIHNSCDQKFKAKAVLVGNIPIDYVFFGRMSEENIAKVKRAVEASFLDAMPIPRSLELLRGTQKYYINPRDVGVTETRN